MPFASFWCLHFTHTFEQNTLLFSSTNNMAGSLSNTWIPEEIFHWKITRPERCKAKPAATAFTLACWPYSQRERMWQQTDYSLQIMSKIPWINKLAIYTRSENQLTSKFLKLGNSNVKKRKKKITVLVRSNPGPELQIRLLLEPWIHRWAWTW